MVVRIRPALTALGVLLVTAILLALLVDRIFFHDSSSPAGTGSGVAATQARALPPFSGVDLAGDNNVIIRVGARRSVVVHADDNLLGRVTTRVRSGRLVIGTTPGNLSTKSPMFVTVSVPSLHALRLRGSGNISATGAATSLDVRISGEGNALLRQLIARDVNAELSGDGSILLTATHHLSATVSGTGTILYGGNPAHVTQNVTGTGTITAG